MYVRHVLPRRAYVPEELLKTKLGGVVVAALAISSLQVKHGHTVDIVSWTKEAVARQLHAEGTRVTRLREWPRARFLWWDLRWLGPVWRDCRKREQSDILHVHLSYELLLSSGASAKIMHIQTPVPLPFPLTYRFLIRQADAVICCSDYIRRQFLKACPGFENRAFSVHNGVDLERFAAKDCAELRERPGDERVVVLYAGAIVPVKGVLHLARAMKELARRFPNIFLLVAGGASLWNQPDDYELAVRKELRGVPVQYLGVVDHADMPAAYHACDLVVVPSIWDEPMGMVACEAMAAGKPVVASKVGGLPEVVIDGKTGLLVPPGSSSALVEAISRLVERFELRQAMGQAGKVRAHEFSWKGIVEQVEQIYQATLISARGARPA